MLALCLSLVLQSDADRILKAYEAARPPDKDLQVFKLDWSPSLTDAKAAKDPRPIFLIGAEQTEDAGSLMTGHC